ncbi:phage terminase large subunit [Glycomyces tenuis]|uniref:phage terminase large subunit n=1 Tax=Glycomyces tenuis TaxID=58116 RepID=UPI000414E032|nr:phage terminase large subunit [Glycomyces tenuis]
MDTLNAFEAAARHFEPPEPRDTPWNTPLDLAVALDPRTVRTPALDLIGSALVDVAEGRCQRLMISMSPQEGKSEACSRRFPTWMLAKYPWLRIAVVSYAHGIARRWGRRIRDDIGEHTDKLGISVDPATSAADEWKLLGHDGSVYCVGIKGALTGKPVDLLIIDDPYRDGEQADSDAWRETVEDWWTEVAIPRLGPGVACVVIQTRWRHDDLSGWLQARDDGIDWRVINIPAKADHDPNKGETDVLGRAVGEYMISARGRTREQWEQRQREVGSRAWLALFQGRPTPASGNVFQRTWFTDHAYEQPQWTEHPNGTRTALGFDEIIASWDMAFKGTDGSDYVCGQVWGRRGVEAWLLDQTHGHLDFVDTLEAVRTLAARWPQATAKYVEDKANGTAVINMLRRTVAGLIPVEPEGSKVARAAAVSPFIEAGNVHVPNVELAPWVGDLIEEAAGFPRAAHDDQVDAMTQALNRLLLNPLLIDNDVIEDDEAEQYISPY